jgi:hypothetical protein
MGVTVGVNGMSVVHKKSGGVTIIFPDVCKTPTPAGPIPIPYPNVARSADTAKGTKRVKADGQSVCVKTSRFSKSNGDEPGTVGGIISNTNRNRAEFINYSFDVKFEGKNVARALDLMLHNKKNTPPSPVMQGPVIASGESKRVCYICDETY